MNVWLGMLIITLFVLALTVLLGLIGVPLLRRLRMGQRVRDDGPETHYAKSGTPTMGGLFFLIPIVLAAIAGPLFFGEQFRPFVVLSILMVLFGVVGFADDFVKVRIDRGGLTVGQKTILLGLFSVAFAVYYLWLSPVEPFILIPFSLQPLMITGWWKALYGVFVVLYLFYISNSVNITDGLDGLLSSLTTIFGLFIAAYLVVGRVPYALNGHIWYSTALAGGTLGFLVHNRYPAKVMMGDTGSQALGAGIAGVCLLTGMPWILLITGFIFVFEGLSVVIQVLYFRHTGGKRIFRMSPIHHHFELGGWSEQKVVRVFAAVAVLLGFIGWLFVWPFVG
ncbi:MAG TPA: phospho-N-acetylmuramoyl-pentapeptide-transferase [Fastidiosipila sp.]|jgi:phospho-N-acetylmuramoyl-pentapeptide-transferase|nr:phospho-N-acetylmuramoyl-pentapeptide-transferase [Fastidiosipila sp.]